MLNFMLFFKNLNLYVYDFLEFAPPPLSKIFLHLVSYKVLNFRPHFNLNMFGGLHACLAYENFNLHFAT